MKKLIAATTTPLASIFGSGFLIIVPILCGAVGKYAVFAMAGVCALAYGVGYVIRFNINNLEPLLEKNEACETMRLLERSSDLALVAAYVIFRMPLHQYSRGVLVGWHRQAVRHGFQ